MKRRIRRGGELLSLAMAITPGSGHCSSLCTQELEMKPKHSSGLRILLLLPRLPQAPLLLLPLARSLAKRPRGAAAAAAHKKLSLDLSSTTRWLFPSSLHSNVCIGKCFVLCPCPLSSLSLSLSRGRKAIIGTHFQCFGHLANFWVFN
jgi:hypothetical protein